MGKGFTLYWDIKIMIQNVDMMVFCLCIIVWSNCWFNGGGDILALLLFATPNY